MRVRRWTTLPKGTARVIRNFALATTAALMTLAPTTAWGQGVPKAPPPTEAGTDAALKQQAAAAESAKEMVNFALEFTRAQAKLAGEKEDKNANGADRVTKQQLEEAQKREERAEKAAVEAKEAVDELRSGKLMSSGFTGGVALAVQFLGPFNNDQAEQMVPVATAMPYVVVLPGYWGAPQATREACASSWSGMDADTIDSAARAITRKRAVKVFDGVVRRVRVDPNVTPKAVIDELQPRYANEKANMDIVKAAKAYVAVDSDPSRKGEAEKFRQDVVEWMAGMEWRASREANCVGRRFGVWFGLPLKYEAMTRVQGAEKPDARRTVDPTIAFGAAFTPSPYLTVMLGLTAASVPLDEAQNRTLWSTTLALGGNLDIATALTK